VSTVTEREAPAPAAVGRRATSLAELARDRNNNFNLIRVILASLVLVHHGFVLTGHPVDESNPLFRLVHNFGEIGVDGFFVVSGFLVTRSLIARHDVVAFVAARVLRIYPGLWTMLALTTTALALLSRLSPRQYFTHPLTITYLVTNATAFLIHFNLPGLFENQANDAVNGSLWSLKYELLCYVGVAMTGVLRLARRKWIFVLGVAACVALFLVGGNHPNYFIGLFRRLGLMFGLGACAAAYADRLPMRLWIVGVLALVAAALDFTAADDIGWSVFWAYSLLWFAYVPKGAILKWNRLPDISYGLYIYAFPVQQSLISTGVATSPAMNMLLAGLATATLATLSWYGIEKPALAFKDHIGRQRDPRVTQAAG
jgi:peptidoglycan/LPS O-acetylase OafA/YrhL